MLSLHLIIVAILFGSKLNSVLADTYEIEPNLCNKSVTLQVFRKENEKENIPCLCGPAVLNPYRDDYVHTPGIGKHKLHTLAKTWNEARSICKTEGGHLAILNSKTEENLLRDVLKQNMNKIRGGASIKDQAYLGIHDMFKEGEWITVFGDSLYTTGYSEWSTFYDNALNNENCGTLIASGDMNDINCNTLLAFFCEIPVYTC